MSMSGTVISGVVIDVSNTSGSNDRSVVIIQSSVVCVYVSESVCTSRTSQSNSETAVCGVT